MEGGSRGGEGRGEWEGVMEQYRWKTCSRVEKGGEGDYIHPHHTPLLFPGYVRA